MHERSPHLPESSIEINKLIDQCFEQLQKEKEAFAWQKGALYIKARINHTIDIHDLLYGLLEDENNIFFLIDETTFRYLLMEKKGLQSEHLENKWEYIREELLTLNKHLISQAIEGASYAIQLLIAAGINREDIPSYDELQQIVREVSAALHSKTE